MPLAVMLRSAASNLGPGRRIMAHILVRELSAENRERIRRSLPDDRVRISWIEIASERLSGLNERIRPFDWVTIETYDRLLLADVLPRDLDKVLYLDCDVLLDRDPGHLWDLEPGEAYLMAAPELDRDGRFVSSENGLRLYRELALPGDLEIFNAGVMLINLKAWRERRLARGALDYLAAAGDAVGWHDQDALNAVVAGRWGKLDARWNVSMHAFRRTNGEASPDDRLVPPWAIHFNSSVKPWDSGFEFPYRDLFFRHLDGTAWGGWRPRESRLHDLGFRLRRAVRKRRHGWSRALRSARQRADEWMRHEPRIEQVGGPPVPLAPPDAVRAFVLAPEPSLALAAIDSCLDRGAERVFVAFEDAPAAPLSRLARERPVHFFAGGSGGASPRVLRWLLDEYGRGRWCLVLLPGEMLAGAGEEGPSLSALCAGLDVEGLEGLECGIEGTGDSDGGTLPVRRERIETVLRDVVRKHVFRGTFEVEEGSGGSTAEDYVLASRVSLFRYRGDLLLADDLRAIGGLRLAQNRAWPRISAGGSSPIRR